jgi:hypothetical protein
MKHCRTCGVLTADFYKGHARCRPCYLKTIKKTKEEYRENNLRWLYKIGNEDYERMLADQDGTCAACPATPDTQRHGRLHVDHDHVTGEVRGLLCHNCNTSIGLLNEDVARLSALITYLSG